VSSSKPVVIYGASGYTGRLVAEYLREYNLPFIAAGRDAARVKDVMEHVPGIGTADYEVVEVEHTVEALTELFSGAQVVCNTVGPFIKYGSEVAEAALRAKCHYLDTTGEQDWVRVANETFGARFAASGLLIAPSTAYMYTTSDIAANICLETPGVDSLDVLVLWGGLPTYASARSGRSRQRRLSRLHRNRDGRPSDSDRRSGRRRSVRSTHRAQAAAAGHCGGSC